MRGAIVPVVPQVCHFESQPCLWRNKNSHGDCRPYKPIEIEGNPYTQRVATTKFLTREELCNKDTDGVNPGKECCKAYGGSCGPNHLDLWCQPSVPTNQTQEKTVKKMQKTAETCTYKGRTCQWYGTSPSCGGNEFYEGMWNSYNGRRRQLIVTTREDSKWQICNRRDTWLTPNPGECCQKYGYGCLSGYKRLWCDE
ncbi:hypothetical protein XA68_17268 [Ophiocordyceps unilateralis]|uniref:Uncharacterized protein n=1 Tax=Ophiocordyceps unilateralis TaxID=268505 RepID=A0A2A9PP67_OPHUN|nr:hypothetical protein XA68_17268 [Ophiocordyceps unilateralis]